MLRAPLAAVRVTAALSSARPFVPRSLVLLSSSNSRLISSTPPSLTRPLSDDPSHVKKARLAASAGSGQGGKAEKEAARKEKERLAKEREDAKKRREKEKAVKEKEKAAKEKEKAAKEKEKAAREKERAKERAAKEKAKAAREKDKAAREKEKEKVRSAKEKQAADKVKQKEKRASAKQKAVEQKERAKLNLERERERKLKERFRLREQKQREKEKERVTKGRAPRRGSRLTPPKAPQNSWAIFFADFLAEKRTTLPAGSKTSLPLYAAEAKPLYDALSTSEKAALRERSEAQKAAYPAVLEAWKKTLTPEMIREENKVRAQRRKLGLSRKKGLKLEGEPKRPVTGFFRFTTDIRAKGPDAPEFAGETDILKQTVRVAEAWRALSDEQKKVYNDAYEVDKERYLKEKKEFAEKHAAATAATTAESS